MLYALPSELIRLLPPCHVNSDPHVPCSESANETSSAHCEGLFQDMQDHCLENHSQILQRRQRAISDDSLERLDVHQWGVNGQRDRQGAIAWTIS